MRGLLLASVRRAQYLRVVGADDSQDAQREKLRVRDAALCALAQGHRQGLLTARRMLRGIAPDAKVSVRLWSPCGSAAVPTVQITLGAGLGHNWFGLLYPEICGESWRNQGARFSWPIFGFLWSLFF